MMEIAAALSGIKGAIEIAKAALDARDDAKAKAAIADMMGLLLEANTSALAMSSEARKLSADLDTAMRELRQLQERQREREKYELHEVARGRFVYRSQVEPAHYLCQNCFDTGVKSVLRLTHYASFEDDLVCANNASHNVALDP
jgi:hypothetical protein